MLTQPTNGSTTLDVTIANDRLHKPGPERPDIAAIPFLLISEGLAQNAARFLKGWRDWYAFEVCEYVFDYAHLAQSLGFLSHRRLTEFTGFLTDIGSLCAALAFQDFSRPKRKALVAKLAKLCSRATKLRLPKSYQRDRTYELQDGLRKASAIALSLGLNAEALAISLRSPHQRPGVWSFRDVFYHNDVFPFMFRAALTAAARNAALHEKDVLPKELASVCSRISRNITGKAFRNKAKKRLSEFVRNGRGEKEPKKTSHTLTYEESQQAERFIDRRLEPLLSLTKALSSVLAAPSRSVDKAFIGLLEAWEDAVKPAIRT